MTLRATRDVLIPAVTIGSLPRPAWHRQTSRGLPFRLALADSAYHEEYTDAVSALLRDQEQAGIDVLTDGDNFLDPYVGGMSWGLSQAERLAGTGSDLESRYPSRSRFASIAEEIDEVTPAAVVTGAVGPGDLQYRAVWEAAQRLTTRPVKFATPSAEVIYLRLIDRHYGDGPRLALDIAAALNEELLAVAAAGCPAIQIDAPWITRAAAHTRADTWHADVYVELFERTVRGLSDRTEVWTHLCWGNSSGQMKARSADGGTPSFGAALALLDGLSCDVLTFENADNGGRFLDEICRGIRKKKVALGVVSHRTLRVETPEEIASLLRRALRHLPPERLVATSDCGFGRDGMNRRVARYKMASMVEGTRVVREEIGLTTKSVS